MHTAHHYQRSERFKVEIWEPGREIPGIDNYFVTRFRTEIFDARPIDSEGRFNDYCRMVASVWQKTLGGKLPLTSGVYDRLCIRIQSGRGFLIESPIERWSGGAIVVREDPQLKTSVMPWDIVLHEGGYSSLEKFPAPRSGLLPKYPPPAETRSPSPAHSFEVQEGAVLFLVAGEKRDFVRSLRLQLAVARERVEVPFETPFAMIGLEKSVVTEDTRRVSYNRYKRDCEIVFSSK